MNPLLLDQGLAPLAAAILRERGIDIEAIHVSEIGLAKAEDIRILEKARDEG
jgi:predicted nuclease of predicted toxin-antitoxin system